jgi:hypothetical protein
VFSIFVQLDFIGLSRPCTFSIFVRVEIVQVFVLAVNAQPPMIHPAHH